MTNFIKSAIKRPGALTAKANKVGESPMAFAKEHEHAGGLTGKQARFAMILQGKPIGTAKTAPPMMSDLVKGVAKKRGYLK
jgi:hypothetical protein